VLDREKRREAVNYIVVLVFYSLLYGPRKHRVFEALAAGLSAGHPLASACCCCIGMVTVTVSTTIPSIDSAATIAITAIEFLMDGSTFPLKH
jgi:hypothetical protein